MRTRRQLIARGVAAGATSALAASWLSSTAALAGGEPDSELIAKTLSVQQLEVFAYRRVLASSRLDPQAGALLGHLLTLEVRHAAALTAQLARLGGVVPSGPADVAAADRELARYPVSGRLAGTRSQRDALRLLIDLESVAEGSCYAAIVDLRDARVARLVAEVMASEAQQWTLLDQLQHNDVLRAVPGPFVEGTD